jgi:predicted sulfurtransferase
LKASRTFWLAEKPTVQQLKTGAKVMKKVQTAGIAVITALTLVVSTFAAEHTKDSLKVIKENVDAKIAVLIDVREKSEWDKGHVEGAVFLPLSELQAADRSRSLRNCPRERLSTRTALSVSDP